MDKDKPLFVPLDSKMKEKKVVESKDVILKLRTTETRAEQIKSHCYDRTQRWGRVYTVSDWFRDGDALMEHFGDVQDRLLANRDLIFHLASRLPK